MKQRKFIKFGRNVWQRVMVSKGVTAKQEDL